MKSKKYNQQVKMTNSKKNNVQTHHKLMQDRTAEIQVKLSMHYANIQQLFAVAARKNTLSTQHIHFKRNCRQTADDQQRLQRTVENLQAQIVQLQQEFYQLIRRDV